MMKNRYWVIALIACLSAIAAVAADSGRVTIREVVYRYYTTSSKSSLHSVARSLGVSPEIVLIYNPWAGQGVDKNLTVLVPAEQAQVAVVPTGPEQQYTLAAGDNIYTVARRFDTSVEALIAANPTIHPDNYGAGTVVKVAPGSASPIMVERSTITFEHYKLRNGDSFYMLAKKNGLTEAELHAANPGVEQLKKGKFINMPTIRTKVVSETPAKLSESELRAYYAPRVAGFYEAAQATLKSRTLNIGMVLPFQLHKEQPPRQALLYTDFYKGFLIALDSLQRRGDAPKLNLTVIDTQHNLNVTDSILASGALDAMNVIVAPGEPQQFLRIAGYGERKGIDVLNCFAVKSDLHTTNANVFQVNTAMSNITDVVNAWIDENFANHNVILLTDKSGEDSEAFTMLRSRLEQSGRGIELVSVPSGDLSAGELSLAMLPGSEYLIIPSNAGKSLLKRILPAIKKVKEERVDCDLRLIGYPEYIMLLKDYQTDLQQVDSYIFSRFFNSNGYRTRNIEFYYNKWFRGQMLTSYPNMVLYGFDTAMFLAESANAAQGIEVKPEVTRGIQTNFRFEPIAGGGYENVAINIAHFTPAKTIETIVR